MNPPLLQSPTEILPANARLRFAPALRAVGFSLATAVFVWSGGGPAQAREVDNRPLLYAMLQGLETNFKPYLAHLVDEHRERLRALDEAARQDLLEFDQDREALNAERSRDLASLARARDTLNQRTSDLNQAIVALEEQIRQAANEEPLAQSLREAMTKQKRSLSAIADLQSQYGIRALAARDAARAHAQAAAQGLGASSTDRSAEIKRARRVFNVTADRANAELAALGKAKEQADNTYREWVHQQNLTLEQSRTQIDSIQQQFAQVRNQHDKRARSLQDDVALYNALAQQLNAGTLEDGDRERAVAEIGRLEPAISAARIDLDRAREKAHDLATQFNAVQAGLVEQAATLRTEQATRKSRLAAAHRDRATRRKAIEAELLAKRQATIARIDALNSKAHDELVALEMGSNIALKALEDTYGLRHRAIHLAISSWLDGGPAEPVAELLSDAAAEDINRRAQFARLQTLVVEAQAAGRTIAELLDQLENAAATDRNLKADWQGIDAERSSIRTRVRELAEANRALNRKVDAAGEALRARIAARKRSHREQRSALATLLDNTRAIGKLEFQLLQSALLQGLGTDAKGVDTSNWGDLQGALGAATSVLPGQLAETDSLNLGHFLTIRAGPVALPWSTAWASYAYQPVTRTEELKLEGRRALAQAWWALVQDKDGILRDIQARLATTPLGESEGRANSLQSVFVEAVRNFARLRVHRLENGRTAISFEALDQRRWLTPEGQLEYLPDS